MRASTPFPFRDLLMSHVSAPIFSISTLSHVTYRPLNFVACTLPSHTYPSHLNRASAPSKNKHTSTTLFLALPLPLNIYLGLTITKGSPVPVLPIFRIRLNFFSNRSAPCRAFRGRFSTGLRPGCTLCAGGEHDSMTRWRARGTRGEWRCHRETGMGLWKCGSDGGDVFLHRASMSDGSRVPLHAVGCSVGISDEILKPSAATE